MPASDPDPLLLTNPLHGEPAPRPNSPLGLKFTATTPETLHDSTIAPGLPRAFFRIAPVH